MKIILEQADLNEPEIIIRGRLSDREVQEAAALLGNCGANRRKNCTRLELLRDEEQFYIDIKDIIYFTAGDDMVYAVSTDGRYRSKSKLYELKDELVGAGFAQISKGVLLNTAFVRSVQAEFSGNYVATLKGTNEKPVISRRYFREFKEKMQEL